MRLQLWRNEKKACSKSPWGEEHDEVGFFTNLLVEGLLAEALGSLPVVIVGENEPKQNGEND